jgi:O-antigen/teichoic acid export membrane protein
MVSEEHVQPKTEEVAFLTSGPVLLKSTAWNLAGQLLPMIVAVIAIPVLIRHLGTDRFGVLTIAWMVVGYFGVFDFGLGRAITNLVAQNLGTDDHSDLGPLIWTGLLLMAILGFFGMLLMAVLSPVIVHSIVKVPSALAHETAIAFELLSLTVPVLVVTSGLRGVLEGYQKFSYVNFVRIPLGILMYAGPLLVLPFTSSLIGVVSVLAIGRVFALIAYCYYCELTVGEFQKKFDQTYIRRLLGFGSWMTVSNLIAPVMIYMDRFFIGALLSVAAVAYYATPYEVATKLLIIPAAMVSVLFPAFSTSMVSDSQRASKLLHQATVYILGIAFPACAFFIAVTPVALRLWLGAEFAFHSTTVLKMLLLGVFMNCIAQVPYAFIQGAGRPDITAKIHLLELPFYLALLWLLLRYRGIEGAAIAWAARATFDAVALGWLCFASFPKLQVRQFLSLDVTIIFCFLCLMLTATISHTVGSALFAVVLLLSFPIILWKRLMSDSERQFVIFRLRLLTSMPTQQKKAGIK